MKLLKVAGLGLVGLFALAVLVLLFGVPAQPVIGYVSDQAAQAGYRLRAGPSKLSLSRSLDLSIDDVHLTDAKDAGEDLLAAQQVRVGLSLLDLLTGNIRVSEIGVTRPVVRLTSGRKTAAGTRASDAGAGGNRTVAIDRLVVEDGTLIMRDAREHLEGRIDAIKLTASLPAQGPLSVDAEGKAGEQILRLKASANSASQIVAGKSTPFEAKLELPGLLKAPLSLSANLKAANDIVTIDGVRGALGSGRVSGSLSVDASRDKPYVDANLVFDRLELAPAAEPRAASRNEPWSDRPIELGTLRVFDATVKLSARELVVENIQLAPAEVEANLSGGLLSVALARCDLYGGPLRGKLVVDAGTRSPRFGGSFQFTNVNALPLLTDAIGFDHLEGRLQGKLDVTAAGKSPAAIVSSVGGNAELNFTDGALRDVNVASMIRALSSQTLQGWQEKGTEKTDFTSLAATFQVANGQANADDLRLAGPLVRMTGKGTVNLVKRTLDFRVDPKLVLSLQGQGGPTDPAGLGVPVVIRGPWDAPQIYPDVAGILDNPQAAFAKLKSMGGSLFGLLNQPGSGGQTPKAEDVIKSLDQMIRGGGDGRNRQPSTDTKNQVRDVIRDLLGR